jgi:DNA-binding Lrp family transcriptional regulator
MAVAAFVLIQVETGKASAAAKSIRSIENVVTPDVVTGPYDVIAKIESATLDDLAKLVASKLHMVSGVTRTYTCPISNL